MFRSPGSKRTHRQNGMLAGYLALVAGYVNAVGFVVLGVLTSHATGNVARFAHELGSRHAAEAGAALLLVTSFFGGALLASLVVESRVFGRSTNAYGVALSLEAVLLCGFAASGRVTPELPAYEGAILCTAMGMQNSLVTRLSGAVVRTTHLTGVVTDLGIEVARWLRWWRAALTAPRGAPVASEGGHAERPSPPKIALLGTIAGSFTVGAVAGTSAAIALGRAADLVPSALLVAGAAYAFATRESSGSIPPPQSR